MKPMNRRQVLKSIALFVTIGQFIPLLASKAKAFGKDEFSERRYRVTFRTRFPSPLTREEYAARKTSSSYVQRVADITNQFRYSGKIISEEFEFTPTGTVWSAIFDSKPSYLEYQAQKLQLKYDKKNLAEFAHSKEEQYV